MNKSSPLCAFRPVLWLLITLLLAGCDNNQFNTAGDSSIPTLNENTVKTFTTKFQKDYDNHLSSLIHNFNNAYKNHDGYAFIDFRNNVWTPAYIKKKLYYAEVYAHNQQYLETSPITPLFERFENLIYIGISLKNGLFNSEQEIIDQALAEAKADQKLVHSIVAGTR